MCVCSANNFTFSNGFYLDEFIYLSFLFIILNTKIVLRISGNWLSILWACRQDNGRIVEGNSACFLCNWMADIKPEWNTDSYKRVMDNLIFYLFSNIFGLLRICFMLLRSD